MAARILVVDHDSNNRRLLSDTLRQAGYEAIAAADGAEGVERWSSERPDLIILDAALPKVDGYQAVTRIRAQEGPNEHVPIILLTGEADLEQRVRALRAEADDTQIKPFHPAEVVARVKSLLARFAPQNAFAGRPPLGRVIAFYGAKGGVGNTTLCINSAVALHRELGHPRVVLVDGNLQFGDHRVFLDLGIDRKSIVDVVTASSIEADIIRSVLVTHDSGVDLLLAPPSPEMAELVNASQHHMAQVLGQLRRLYDYVLVDIDKRLDENNLDVIAAADVVLVVMIADLACLKNVRLVLETMTQLGVGNEKVKLVLNRSSAFTGINVKAAEGALKRKIDFQVVNEYRGAISALNAGAPFLYAKAESALGRSVTSLARSIEHLGEQASGRAELAGATS